MAKQGNVQSVIINIDLLETMKAELEKVDLTGEIRKPCTIYRMLPSARSKHSEEYEPQIISIGPLHVKNTTLDPMKSVKWRYLRDLLHRRPDVQDMLQRYIKRVKELEEGARKKYAEVIELDSDAFVQIMVVDACFIIEWLIKWCYRDKNRHQLGAEKWNLQLLRNDLLLLENQIPFFVLESLFELSNIPGLLHIVEGKAVRSTLVKFAISYVTQGKSKRVPATLDPKNVHHLLHVFQLSFLPTSSQRVSTASSCRHTALSTIKKIRHLVSGCIFWLLSLFLYRRRPLKCWECPGQLTDEERLRAPRMIPTATELEESGVEFRRKLEATSVLDITFRDGVMEIPLLSVEESTVAKFRNLIVFEQCCPTAGSYFTSYAGLLDNIINTPKDVAILKKCGIVESMLGQDDEVANLFNSLCQDTYLDYEQQYFAQLFKDVKEYSEADRHRWRARLMHDYFENPWAIISVIAAIFLLVLTVLQTFFAVYGYYRPPKHS